MTISNPNTIDIVATKPDDPLVRLVVADHFDWDEEEGHFLSLQAKLNAYMAFVESGQLYREFPDAAGKDIQIEIVFLHAPHKIAQEYFLQQAKNLVNAAGMAFTWRIRPETA